jgi:hypothetical protein
MYFKVDIIAQRLEKILPNPFATPAIETLVDRVPAAKLLGQNTPMCF